MSAKQLTALREYRTRQQFQRKLEQLRFELSVNSPRRVLDYLIDHLEDLLPRCGDSLIRENFTEQLERAHELVASRHNLRLVHWVRS